MCKGVIFHVVHYAENNFYYFLLFFIYYYQSINKKIEM